MVVFTIIASILLMLPFCGWNLFAALLAAALGCFIVIPVTVVFVTLPACLLLKLIKAIPSSPEKNDWFTSGGL